MGGINSGRRRTVTRGAVEQFPAIDLRVLKRAGLICAGECTYDTLHWRNQAPETLSAKIFVDLSDADDASMRVVMSGERHRIAMECMPCPYGGIRAYFLCPINGKRCEQLFLVDSMFASRQAHRLTYASQSEDDLSRARRKVRKLRRQVEGDTRYARPRGRNRYTKVLGIKQAKCEANEFYYEKLTGIVCINQL